MWDLFKTDAVPVTSFPFMTSLRSKLSEFEYEEYEERREDRLDAEQEKLWQLSWRGKGDTESENNFVDKDRTALKAYGI
jgi:hypothetical protein